MTTSARSLSGGVSVYRRADCGIHNRTRRRRSEKFSELGRHQREPLQSGRHQRRRLPENQNSVAAISNGYVAGAARARTGSRGLRQLLGYESVPLDYDVAGAFDYVPVTLKLEDLQAKALAERPDLRAARQGVTAANSQYELQKANGKVDLTGTVQLLARERHEQRIAFRERPDSDIRPQPGRNRARAVCDHAGTRTAKRSKRPGDDRRAERLRRAAHKRRRSSRSTAPATSRSAQDSATSASTRTSAAPRACSIILTPNAAIAPRNSPIGKHSRRISRPSSSFAKRWEQGICHETAPRKNACFAGCVRENGSLDASRSCCRTRFCLCSLGCGSDSPGARRT